MVALRWHRDDVERLVQVALHVAAVQPTTKAGVAMVREARSLQHFAEMPASLAK
jgi:hypothetical protein